MGDTQLEIELPSQGIKSMFVSTLHPKLIVLLQDGMGIEFRQSGAIDTEFEHTFTSACGTMQGCYVWLGNAFFSRNIDSRLYILDYGTKRCLTMERVFS